jgi:hypothetical protein
MCKTLYVDHEAVCSSHHLWNIYARLGVDFSHSKPYYLAGCDKIERIFVNSEFDFDTIHHFSSSKVATQLLKGGAKCLGTLGTSLGL